MFVKVGESRCLSSLIYKFAMILFVNITIVKCGPLMTRTTDGSWDENMVDCSPGGRCWEWLHKQDLASKPEFYEDPLRAQIQQERDLPVAQLPVAGLPSSNRIAKKDVFVSRGWGAGGMPFSVLYLNPHSPRSNGNAGPNEIDPARVLPLESATHRSPSRHSNNRVALRNGASGQQRRQYSIIPQLFVSYGWGPLGK